MKSAPLILGDVHDASDSRRPVLLPPIDVHQYEGPAQYLSVHHVRAVDVVASARVAIEGLINLNNRDMVATGRKSEAANLVALPRALPVAPVELIERLAGTSYEDAVAQALLLAAAYHRQIDLFRSMQATMDSRLCLRYMGKISHCSKAAIELVVRGLSHPQNADRRVARLLAALDGFVVPLMEHWCSKEYVPTKGVERITCEVITQAVVVEFLPLLLEAMETTDSRLMRFINANTSDRAHEVSSAGWFKRRAETAALKMLREYLAARTRPPDACAVLIAFEKANLLSSTLRAHPEFARLKEALRKLTPRGFAEKSEVIRCVDGLASAATDPGDVNYLTLLRLYLVKPESDPNFIVAIAVRNFWRELAEVTIECVEDNVGTRVSDIVWRKLPKLAYHLTRGDPKTSDDVLKIIRDLVRFFSTDVGKREKLYRIFVSLQLFYAELFHGVLKQVSESEFPIVDLLVLLVERVRGCLGDN